MGTRWTVPVRKTNFFFLSPNIPDTTPHMSGGGMPPVPTPSQTKIFSPPRYPLRGPSPAADEASRAAGVLRRPAGVSFP